jgi:SAM-dependent methyltransferase
MLSRRQKLLNGIDLTRSRGLEVGPLHRPLLKRSESQVFYVDHCSTAELKAKYADDPAVPAASIVDVDYVWAERSLRDAVGPGTAFHYVLASHVIEHVPDLVGWINEIAEVLEVGGKLCLAVPDKRYTFDVARSLTPASILIEDYLLRRSMPSPRAVFDHLAGVVAIDAESAWGEGFDPAHHPRHHSLEEAFARAREQVATPSYLDVHVTVLTSSSFLELARTLIALGLFPYRVAKLFPTEFNEPEFIVQLEKLDPTLSAAARRDSALASIDALTAASAAVPADLEGLRRTVAERDALIAAMRSSLSWRVTAPLRSVRPVLRRVKRIVLGLRAAALRK